MSKENAPPKVEFIELDLLDPMAGNREYKSGQDNKSMKELADSILEKGILQPLIVRPHPEKKGRYEICAGCRRHKAAGIAKLPQAPCIVKELTDAEAREIRAIENVQRVNIHEMEEALNYQDLLDLREEKTNKPLHDVASIAGKIGKSEAYVYARIKLLRMPDCAQEAFLNGKLNASVALLLCRIPEAKQAYKASLEVLDRCGSGITPEREKRAIDPEFEPMSFRDAKRHIQQKYMRRLKGSKFDQEDETLVPVVYEMQPPASTTPIKLTGKAVDDFKAREAQRNGANGSAWRGERLCGGKCSDCPFRTGNMKKLAPDLIAMAAEGHGEGGSADVCTNTDCYNRKEKAHEKREADKFKAKGQQLLTESKTRNILSHDGTELNSEARGRYIDLREKAPGTKKTWEEVLDPHLPDDTTPVVARGKKNLLLLEVTPEVIKAGQKAGVKIEKPADNSAEARAKEEEKRERKKEFLKEVVTRASKQFVSAVKKAKPEELLRFYVLNRLAYAGSYLAGWDGKEKPDEKQVASAVKKMDLAELCHHIAFNSVPNSVSWQGELEEDFKELCEFHKIDLKELMEEVGKEQKAAEEKAEKVAAKDSKADAKEKASGAATEPAGKK